MKQKDLSVALLTGSAKRFGAAIAADLAIHGSAHKAKTLCKHIVTDRGRAGVFQSGRDLLLSESGQTNRYLWATPSVTRQIFALDSGQHLMWQTPCVTGQIEW